ncbi:MAG: hypothetical protein F6K18_30635 [Okeania sp. SIO2C2]|uniref:hypothetical protein n=1 Tax=Okeania sp. SIO2C2 TaxID=2607787 RepID=UPI0013BC5786|nr:hypothetical protein [Okeania sp. SIO2C2]NEP90815.1 hypothetical protein [Okeania sp. SIO2C2]
MEEILFTETLEIDETTVFSLGDEYATLDRSIVDAVKAEFKLGEIYLPVPEDYAFNVTGKEYSNNADKDTNGTPDPGQTLEWFGNGLTNDGFDYGIAGQVDAMANRGDAFFHAVIANQANLSFSTTFDDNIYFQTPSGWNGVDYTRDQIDLPGVPGPIDPGVLDVDALEVWGPVDANRFSIYGYPNVAVYDHNPVTGINTPLYFTPEIARAIGVPRTHWHLVNVDAMMTFGNDLIMFSVDPISEVGLDGGEIWVWDRAAGGAASFLDHGGNTFDTGFDVMGTFGTASENINALEAVQQYYIPWISPEFLIPTEIPSEGFIADPLPLSIEGF